MVKLREPRLRAEDVCINNIHDAIRSGKWDFEPEQIEDSHFDPTPAMPGTDEKLEVLAARAKAGLPLWNSQDRTEYDDPGSSGA